MINARGLVVALVLVSAGCSTTTGGAMLPLTPVAEYSAMGQSVDTDVARLNDLNRSNDLRLGDWTPVCADLASDAAAAARTARTYAWPSRAHAAALSLADGFEIDVVHARQCADAEDVYSMARAVLAMPNLDDDSERLLNALR